MDVLTELIKDPFCGGLIRTTLFLTIGFCLVEGFLSFFRISSARIHQFCWFMVLLLGWVWVRPVVDVSFSSGTAWTAGISLETKSAESVVPSLFDAAFHKQVAFVVLFVWMVGICVELLRTLYKFRRFRQTLSGTMEPLSAWREQWEKMVKYQTFFQQVSMRVSTQAGPTLVRRIRGFEIVVPMELWETLEPRERACLLRLQLAHLRNYDLWKYFLVRILVLPHWFNPFAWLVLRRFDGAVKFASDEQVYHETSESPEQFLSALSHWRDYLERLSNHYSPEQQFAIGCHYGKDAKFLAERVRRLEAFQQNTFFTDTALQKAGLAGVLTLIFLALVVQIDSNKTQTGSENQAHSQPFGIDWPTEASISPVNPPVANRWETDLDALSLFPSLSIPSSEAEHSSSELSPAEFSQQWVEFMENASPDSPEPLASPLANDPNSLNEPEKSFRERFPNARTPFVSQLIKPDFRPIVILDDHGHEVKNPAIALFHEKLQSFLLEEDAAETIDMIRAIPDRRVRLTLLIEFCDQLAYLVKTAYSERQINQEELFQNVEMIGYMIHLAFETAKGLKSDAVRDDAYAALAERSAQYVGDFIVARETLLQIQSPLLRSKKLVELAEVQKINDSPDNANETLRLSRESLKTAIPQEEPRQQESRETDPSPESDMPLFTNERHFINR